MKKIINYIKIIKLKIKLSKAEDKGKSILGSIGKMHLSKINAPDKFTLYENQYNDNINNINVIKSKILSLKYEKHKA